MTEKKERDRPETDQVREQLIEEVSATLSAYYDAVSPRGVAEELVDLISSRLGE